MPASSGYQIQTSCERRHSEADGEVFIAIYRVQDDHGRQGDPIVVAGTFPSAEDALAAAQEAGGKVIDQLR